MRTSVCGTRVSIRYIDVSRYSVLRYIAILLMTFYMGAVGTSARIRYIEIIRYNAIRYNEY